jgi:hypothetical protein
VFRIGGNTFYDRKNKIPIKIPKFKRSGIGLITEFRGIPTGFPNQVAQARDRLSMMPRHCYPHRRCCRHGASKQQTTNDAKATSSAPPLLPPQVGDRSPTMPRHRHMHRRCRHHCMIEQGREGQQCQGTIVHAATPPVVAA